MRWPMSSALDASEALHARVRAAVRAFGRGQAMPEAFDALAVDIARFQAEHVPGYARLCAARGVRPGEASRAADFPAVPTDAFKVARVFAFDDARAAVVFRTSGTTVGARGSHAMRVVATYDEAALAFGRATLGAGMPDRVAVLVVGPSADEAPDSSLARMCTRFASAVGQREAPERTFFVREGKLDVEGLRGRIRALAGSPPAIVLATSFALVHLLDALGPEVLALPVGSRVMQTGGFKGRSREVAPAELRRAVSALFAVDERAVVSEYGMTELSSQLWETSLLPGGARDVFAEPPWARVVPVDPETLAPVPDGAVGLARIEDLANVDSAAIVLAQDRVRRVAGGVELLGRATGAPPRGCSIAMDEILGGADAQRG
jgi:hypothetical protein